MQEPKPLRRLLPVDIYGDRTEMGYYEILTRYDGGLNQTGIHVADQQESITREIRFSVFSSFLNWIESPNWCTHPASDFHLVIDPNSDITLIATPATFSGN